MNAHLRILKNLYQKICRTDISIEEIDKQADFAFRHVPGYRGWSKEDGIPRIFVSLPFFIKALEKHFTNEEIFKIIARDGDLVLMLDGVTLTVQGT